jgi:hypothetical protein
MCLCAASPRCFAGAGVALREMGADAPHALRELDDGLRWMVDNARIPEGDARSLAQPVVIHAGADEEAGTI